ncbi:MAG: PorT family protein [Saprospiraceae bacterium]|nr:PorT family protein [Saprospiraceae bacterium]MDW8485039.1 porin family protein [Saprospiraceae bacterium]
MKNRVVFLAILSLVSLNAVYAQLSGVGFRPMATFSTYKLSKDLNDIHDSYLRLGGGGALFAEFNLGSRFTFQPEIVYVQRGANLKSESRLSWNGQHFGYPRDYQVKEIRRQETLHYLDIPLMFEKNFGGGGLGAYVAFGPAISIAVANGFGREEIDVVHLDLEGKQSAFTDRKEYTIEMGRGRYDDYRKGDLSVNLGAGIVLILDSGEIGLDVRYTHGLRNIDISGIKNRTLSVGLSYMYYF